MLGKKPERFLGVDLSPDAIKVVELESHNGKPQLVTYGYTETKPDVLRGDFIENKNITSTLLKEVCQRAKTTSTIALAALPLASVFTSVVQIPSIPKKDLSDRVKLKTILASQVKNILPMPLDQMLFDFNLVNPAGIEQLAKDGTISGARFLITATANTVVKNYVEIFKQAGLTLTNLDIEPFSLVRALVGADTARIMIADIGENVTAISVVEQGVPVINRAISVGSATVTKAIADTAQIDIAQAEQYKLDLAIMLREANAGYPQAVDAALRPIIAEMKYVVKMLVQQSGPDTKVDKIILTGGGASLAQLAPFVTNELQINAYVGDPWARVIYPEELRSVLAEIGPRFSVSVGLAMRDIVH